MSTSAQAHPTSPGAEWTPEDTERALRFWEEYTRQHDLSHLEGRVAAIDPVTGRIWIDESAVDIAARMEAEGVQENPVYLVRVGFPTFIRKGRR